MLRLAAFLLGLMLLAQPAAAAQPRARAAPDQPGLPAVGDQPGKPAAAALPGVSTTESPGVSTTESPGVPVSDAEVVQGDPSLANMALIFNVGAGFEPATAILDALADAHQHATFFVMGWWAARHTDLLRQIADGGHEIASHGHSIFDLTQASDAQVREDLLAADAAISAVTGRGTRPLWSPSAGYRNARVRAIAASLGYRPILWTVDSGDWTSEATPESVYSHIVNGAANGAIIVLHFDSPMSRDATAQVLPAAVQSLRDAGYTLLTITELLTRP
jgi:peptidoglycan/xylan/chitin deacetylase (PgdA/CDA1 family)